MVIVVYALLINIILALKVIVSPQENILMVCHEPEVYDGLATDVWGLFPVDDTTVIIELLFSVFMYAIYSNYLQKKRKGERK